MSELLALMEESEARTEPYTVQNPPHTRLAQIGFGPLPTPARLFFGMFWIAPAVEDRLFMCRRGEDNTYHWDMFVSEKIKKQDNVLTLPFYRLPSDPLYDPEIPLWEM